MDELPAVLVVGSDALADRVCEELARAGERAVRVLANPDSDAALNSAGVHEATAILALSSDDALNLAVALRARMLNPNIRIVLQQFNVVLGQKIEQNLPNCTVLSSAADSAATYAAAALDPHCFFAQRFPEVDGPLVGFVSGTGAELHLAGHTVNDAQRRLETRILSLDEAQAVTPEMTIAQTTRVVAFRHITDRGGHRKAKTAAVERRKRSFSAAELSAAYHRLNPILRTYLVSAAVFLIVAYLFFHFVLGKSWLSAAYDITEAITNAGLSEPAVTQQGLIAAAGTMLTMIGGILFTTIFIGFVSSAFTRAQWTAMQGLRRIRARDHVVMCGAGKLGSVVIDLLAAAGKTIVVIEPNPDPWLLRRARSREVRLLTGDATRDDALALCDIENASAVLALTNNDSVNLEIALGTRARSADVPLVVRMNSETFAQTTAALFGIATFSQTALTAPAFAALARSPGTRGVVRYAGSVRTVWQRSGHEVAAAGAAGETLLCYLRDGAVHVGGDFAKMRPWDTVLYLT